MSTEITKAHSQQYAANVQLLVQQKMSKLRGAASQGSYTGKAAEVVNQIGAITLVPHVRHADTPIINTPHDVRWVRPIDREGAQLVDAQDFLRMIADPRSSYVQTGQAAANRAIDQEAIDQFFGTNLTGEDMGTSVVWDTYTAANPSHLVDSSGATNMTVSKLRAAKKAIMAENFDVDNEQLFCVINASMHDSLLGETLAASVDYNSNGGGRPILEDGRIRSFMGFNFINTELLPSRASNKHSAMVFVASCFHIGMWNDVVSKVSERNDKSHATQIYTSVTCAATRVQEKGCAEIVCAD